MKVTVKVVVLDGRRSAFCPALKFGWGCDTAKTDYDIIESCTGFFQSIVNHEKEKGFFEKQMAHKNCELPLSDYEDEKLIEMCKNGLWFDGGDMKVDKILSITLDI